MLRYIDTLACLLIISATALIGCGRNDRRAATTTRDSAGVSIVESRTPVWTDSVGGWRVDTVPRLEIGVQTGQPEYQFYRLMDAVVLPDDVVVATNAGSGELRFYDSDGRFIRAVGGRGAGPGEFNALSTLRICTTAASRLLVADGGQNRVNVFSTAGAFLHAIRLEAADGGRPPGILGCFGNGDMLGVSWPRGGTLRGEPGTVIEGALRYVLVDRDGYTTATIAETATRPRFVNQVGNIVHYPFIPFTPEPLIAAGQNVAYLSTGGSASVQVLARDGSLRRVERWAAARQSVASVWDRYKKASLEEIPQADARRRYAHFYAQDLPLPDSVPALQALLVDEQGNVWAERYRLPWDSETRWDVIDPGGRWLGSVTLPARFQPFEIGPDYVLGRRVDALGVERLVMLRLEK